MNHVFLLKKLQVTDQNDSYGIREKGFAIVTDFIGGNLYQAVGYKQGYIRKLNKRVLTDVTKRCQFFFNIPHGKALI